MRSFGEYAPKMLENPNSKISFCYIHYRNGSELSAAGKYCAGMCGIAATTITVESDYMNQFYNGMMSIFHEMLFYKMGHAEEQVLTCFYDRHPELCTIYNGDYYSILTNYHFIREDYHSVKYHFIHEAINKGRKNIASVAACKIIESVNAGIITLDNNEVNWLHAIKGV
jgi:hypothetical protein